MWLLLKLDLLSSRALIVTALIVGVIFVRLHLDGLSLLFLRPQFQDLGPHGFKGFVDASPRPVHQISSQMFRRVHSPKISAFIAVTVLLGWVMA